MPYYSSAQTQKKKELATLEVSFLIISTLFGQKLMF